MRSYQGISPDDPKLSGGGKYNETHEGLESRNFLEVNGKLFGFVQPPLSTQAISLERISPDASGHSLAGVLVIMVAKRPEGGQMIVGWYRNATVFREQKHANIALLGKKRWHNLEAGAADAVLLPEELRKHHIPVGSGALGQSNVFYPLNAQGKARAHKWMSDAVRYVESYEASNSLADPTVDAQRAAVAEADAARSAAEGQGYAVSPRERKSIEMLAMKKAMQHFRKHHSRVVDVSATHSYDLHCGRAEGGLKVEVKGTTGSKGAFFVTRAEAALAKKEPVTLFLLHSIRLIRGKATGGEAYLLKDYGKKVSMRPLSFECMLSE
jgi:hypothetical protein